MRVPLSELRLSPTQRGAVDRVLESGWLSMGPETARAEEAWREEARVGHAFLTSSCTASLWLALAAVGVGPGDEVLVPSLTFVADANVVVRLGARPVLCDVEDVRRPLLDLGDAKRRLTSRTKAVLPVHYGGYEVDIDALRATLPGLAVVEDCAHAPGPLSSGRWPGGRADVSCYSFFSNKNLGVGEGGLVSTNDAVIADRLRLLRSHGMSSLTWDRHRGHAWSYDVLLPGMNFRPSEIVAALVGAGLGDLHAENDARRKHLLAYRQAFAGSPLVLVFDESDDTTAHIAVLDAGDADCRDRVRAELADAGIQTSMHYPPIHLFTWYRDNGLSPAAGLPVVEAAAGRLLTLPLWGRMSGETRDEIAHRAIAAAT